VWGVGGWSGDQQVSGPYALIGIGVGMSAGVRACMLCLQ
jgi:hypothetical protein